MEFFIIVVIIAVFAILIPLGIKQSQQTNAAWSQAARQLGLHYQPSGFLQSRKITGMIQNYSITVDTYTQRSNNSSTTYTRFRLTYPSLGLGLKLTKEGFFTGVTKIFGAQDIQVDDAAFDTDILIKGANPQRVREFLTPARRMRIHQYLRNHPNATIDDREIAWRSRGLIKQTGRLTNRIRNLVRLAWHLTGDRDDDETLGQALNAQDDGRPDEALTFLQDLTAASETKSASDQAPWKQEPVEEQLLKGELLYMADRRAEAQEAFQAAQEMEPDDPEIAEWVENLPKEPDQPAASQPAQLADELDVALICQELFAGNKMSYQISRLFEQNYAGKTVRWSGRLRRVESYSFELVFGIKPGCKAVVSVHELETSGFGDRTVSAIVQFPKENLEPLQKREGQNLRFEGQLKKVDALMRNFYIADGRFVD